MLYQDARHFHVHSARVRTRSPGHTQPDWRTRKQLWKHLVTVYREAYPCADSPTSSILQCELESFPFHLEPNTDSPCGEAPGTYPARRREA